MNRWESDIRNSKVRAKEEATNKLLALSTKRKDFEKGRVDIYANELFSMVDFRIRITYNMENDFVERTEFLVRFPHDIKLPPKFSSYFVDNITLHIDFCYEGIWVLFNSISCNPSSFRISGMDCLSIHAPREEKMITIERADDF